MLAKSKLNNLKVWISKALIDSNICHDEYGMINNVLKECDNVKKKKKNQKFKEFNSVCKTMLLCCLKCRKNKESKNPKVGKTKHARIVVKQEQEVTGLLSA